MWDKAKGKFELGRRQMATPLGSSYFILSTWDKSQLMLWLANMLYALAVILLIYALLFLAIHLPVFPLKHVDVKGELKHVTREQVELIVGREFKGNFFTLDLLRARKAFEKLPWVRNVNVRRRWPDRLEVTLEEHQVLARWGNLALVNTNGEIFQAASNQDLPVFYGPAGSEGEIAQHYYEFRQELSRIGLQPSQIIMSPRRAWEIRLKSGMELALGRDQVEARLDKFVRVYDQTLARISRPVTYVDLRYPNGFAVRLPAGMQLKTKPTVNS